MKYTAPTISLIQSLDAGSAAANLDRTLSMIEAAAKNGAQVICTQELFLGPYFCQTHDQKNFDLAEPIPGPTTESLSKLAKRFKIVIVASLFEKRAPGIYHNTAAVIDADGSLLGTYRKTHIPHDPLFYEKYYFTPGDQGYRAFDTAYGRIGVLVCWDQWFPEAARLTALQGAQILFYPTAIGWHPREKAEFGAAQRDAWITMQRAHAIANGVFVAACNRIGLEKSSEGELEFWGSSFIADPFGRILAQASTDEEENLTARCDFNLIEETRRNWPFLRDRRVDAYGDLLKKFGDVAP